MRGRFSVNILGKKISFWRLGKRDKVSASMLLDMVNFKPIGVTPKIGELWRLKAAERLLFIWKDVDNKRKWRTKRGSDEVLFSQEIKKGSIVMIVGIGGHPWNDPSHLDHPTWGNPQDYFLCDILFEDRVYTDQSWCAISWDRDFIKENVEKDD